ncbi:leucine-rich repeat domain, L domain-like protein, partial [Tanacetum coccineum]
QLESLSLNRCWGLSASGLMPLQMYGSKLQSLNLSFCPRLTDNGLSYVASGCPLLSVCLNQNCRQLTKLGISRCDKILGEGFQGVSPTLACLEAKNCSFDSEGVSAILSGGGLKYLNCGIEYLNLPSFKDPRECDLAAIGFGFGSHIKILALKNCNFVEDATITKIAEGCPLLQEWNLSGCDKITDLGWQSIGSNCQNLEILHADRCKNLSKRGFQFFVVGCARLSVIYMTSCRQISHDWIRKFMHQKNNVKIKHEESRQIITPQLGLYNIIMSRGRKPKKTSHLVVCF